MELSIRVPIEELQNAQRLLALVTSDERVAMGQVRLASDGTCRRWQATDSSRAAMYFGGSDTEVYEFGVSPGLIAFAAVAAGDSSDVVIECVDNDEVSRVSVIGPGGSMHVALSDEVFPDIDWVFADREVAAHVRVAALDLFHLVNARRVREVPGDDEDDGLGNPPYSVEIVGDQLRIRVLWSEVGATFYEIPTGGSSGHAELHCNPFFLESLIRLFEGDDEIDIRFPSDPGRPFQLVSERCVAALMPIKPAAQQLRESVEQKIREVAGHLALVQDHDGDYLLSRRLTRIYGRLVDDSSPPMLQVFAVLLDEVEPNAELYAELNDLNSQVGFARIFFVGGQVLAEVDLVAATLDHVELATAINRISDLSERVSPMLAAVFGGEAIEDPAVRQWQLYRSAIIDAEVSPGALVALNGHAAVEAWPFPGPVHVVTGWNPQGVSLGESTHRESNLRIASEILGMGARFVHGHGRSPSGDHAEPSLIAYGLDRDDAIEIGRRASQDAIFEIDAEAVRLLSCVDGRVDNWQRLD